MVKYEPLSIGRESGNFMALMRSDRNSCSMRKREREKKEKKEKELQSMVGKNYR